MQHQIMGMLKEIAEAAQTAKWAMMDLPPPVQTHDATARGFTGRAGAWEVLLLSFSIEDQGYPAGSRGYMGTALNGGTMLRLTRELAEKLFKLAEKSGVEPQGHQAI
jgi:hypothetical protein